MKNRLLKLLADNRAVPHRRFGVVSKKAAEGTTGDEAEVFLYDAIVDDELEAEFWGGVAPQPFVKALREISAGTIHLRINSPGGSVFGARAIETALREHPAQIIVHVDGLAASAASFVAMAGDSIVMAPGAMIMIHKAWTLAFGNADDLVSTAALLEKVDGTLVQTYAARTKQGAERIAAWMADETWFTADEAVQHGFADSVVGQADGADASANAWNLSAYAHAPWRTVPVEPVPTEPAAATVDAAALIRRLMAAALPA